MKRKSSLPLLAALTLSAAPVSAASDYIQVTTEAAFSTLVIDKPLVRNHNAFTIRANGTLTGVYNGREMVGTWEWVGDAFCRTLTTPRRGYSCQKITSNGENARFMRYPNNGMSLVQDAVARNN